MPPMLSPREFIAKWRGDTRKERSVSQEHFIDLCRLVGHETPGENRDGTLVFEAGAAKSAGGQGWADVWKKGVFGWEYKGPRADLGKAYQQLQQYRDSLQNPPLLVVSDIQSIVIHTNFVNTVKRQLVLTLDDLDTPQGLQTLRNVFFQPEALRPETTIQQVTEAAAADFARLADLLRRYGEQPQAIAHFLIRLLFCLFAEDIGLLPAGVFTRIITTTRHKAPAFAAQVKALFGAMATGGYFGTDEIKYFDGGLFDDDTALPLDSDGLAILERVSRLDWGNVEPSIFGTLFERSLDPSKRSQLGAHYTGREDIMLIVEPVLMLPLRRRWAEVETKARNLASQRDAASGPRRNRYENDLRRLLADFATEIASIRVLDPACGSGNFLYVALKQLLDLEKQVINLGADLGLTRMMPLVGPEQLYGIEVNEYAHELAQVTVWIGYIQWLRDNGFGEPSQPILQPLTTITRQDAILAFDAHGQPVEPTWPEADAIIGNPPFLGDKKMRAELGPEYVQTVRHLYEGRIAGGADLVTYWFERARAMIERGEAKRAGLLSTNSIRYGANRKVLERIISSGSIFMAWSDRHWFQEGAAVRVSMVGFDNGTETVRLLDNATVGAINADLTGSANVASAQRLHENADMCFLGMMKGGPFDIDSETARHLLAATGNSHGRPNSDVVKPRLGGQDITGRPRNGFVVDFVEMPEADAMLYQQPFEYVRRVVKPVRDTVRDSRMRTKWWLHGRSRPALRAALQGKLRCIVTPEVAKHRIFVWMSTETIPDHTCHVIARDDDYFFGVLQSHLHEIWSLRVGNYMGVGNDPRYNSSRTFETFPFPWPPGQEPAGDPLVEAIADAARQLVQLRDDWLNEPGLPPAELKKRTLTNLYNARPSWLVDAHQQLDAAVFAAYGWPANLSEEEILSHLLELNQRRAAAQGAPVVAADEGSEADAGEE